MRSNFPNSKALRFGRYSERGRIYFITSRSEGGLPLFGEPKCATILLQEGIYQGTLGDCQNLAFVVMPDHFHWLIQLTGNRSLQKIVGSLKGRSGRRINHVRDMRGRVWQAGFHDHAVRAEEDLENLANYLLQNPVRAGLVKDAREYPYWNSVWHDRG